MSTFSFIILNLRQYHGIRSLSCNMFTDVLLPSDKKIHHRSIFEKKKFWIIFHRTSTSFILWIGNLNGFFISWEVYFFYKGGIVFIFIPFGVKPKWILTAVGHMKSLLLKRPKFIFLFLNGANTNFDFSWLNTLTGNVDMAHGGMVYFYEAFI